jgi:hypothetical protein
MTVKTLIEELQKLVEEHPEKADSTVYYRGAWEYEEVTEVDCDLWWMSPKMVLLGG